jgi:hypothetical protein
MKKKPQNDTLSQKTRKDYVGKSGVYPMSGPHPAGPAPIRGQMEWGQGERGAAGYYDHGSSELSMESGVVLGGFDQNWPSSAEIGTAIPPISEIPVAEWPAFCAWITENFRGVVIHIEREERGETTIAARERPFEELIAHILENSVAAITIVAEGKPRKIRLNVAGPQRLKLYRNPAGWPTQVEIGYANGRAIIHFTGNPEDRPGSSSNAWGE